MATCAYCLKFSCDIRLFAVCSNHGCHYALTQCVAFPKLYVTETTNRIQAFKSRFKGPVDLSLKMGRGDEQKTLMHCIIR